MRFRPARPGSSGAALHAAPFHAAALLAATLAAATLAAAPAGAQEIVGPFRLHADGVPPEAATAIRGDLEWARSTIEERLGPFPDTVVVTVHPRRAGFTAALRDAWGIPETACWMVGAADDHALHLLSPSVWGDEACEHDPGDADHRRRLIAHEAVHAYHGQVNPSEDIGLLEEIGWLIEGVATYVSGQLESRHAGRAREALETGAAPERLADAWAGPYRYGVAGSMAAYIDGHWGRDTLRRALRATTGEELLALLGTTEPAFLDAWAAWVLSPLRREPPAPGDLVRAST